MEFKDRFKEVMDHLNVTPMEFSERLGVQRSSISHILTGRNKPSISLLQKLFSTYPSLNPSFVINGQGNVVLPSFSDEEPRNPMNRPRLDLRFGKNETQESPSFQVEKRKADVTNVTSDVSDVKAREPKLERIVFFYSDGSAKVYSPE